MSTHEVAIHEDVARRIAGVLVNFLSESAAGDALLIDRSGQLLAQADSARSLDTVSMSALAAGAFSSTAAMARLLGEPEFTMLFHQGVRESIHVTAVDDEAILLATFDNRTTVGMVRLFAAEASATIRAILIESRARAGRGEALGVSLDADEATLMFRARSR